MTRNRLGQFEVRAHLSDSIIVVSVNSFGRTLLPFENLFGNWYTSPLVVLSIKLFWFRTRASWTLFNPHKSHFIPFHACRSNWESKYGLWQSQDGLSHSNSLGDIDIAYLKCDTCWRKRSWSPNSQTSCRSTENLDMYGWSVIRTVSSRNLSINVQ